jgi:hypothetical protein
VGYILEAAQDAVDKSGTGALSRQSSASIRAQATNRLPGLFDVLAGTAEHKNCVLRWRAGTTLQDYNKNPRACFKECPIL